MNLSELNTATLTEREQMQLYSFYDAYNRKYPPAMTWRDCKAEGLTRKEYQSCGLDDIESSLDELDVLASYTIDEDGCVVAKVESNTTTWQDRLINKWKRRDEWTL
jgi:hypothetical protein